MRYKLKPIEVTAIQLKTQMRLVNIDGDDILGEVGDWLITQEDEQFFMPDDEFQSLYEPIQPKLMTALVTSPEGTTSIIPEATNKVPDMTVVPKIVPKLGEDELPAEESNVNLDELLQQAIEEEKEYVEEQQAEEA